MKNLETRDENLDNQLPIELGWKYALRVYYRTFLQVLVISFVGILILVSEIYCYQWVNKSIIYLILVNILATTCIFLCFFYKTKITHTFDRILIVIKKSIKNFHVNDDKDEILQELLEENTRLSRRLAQKRSSDSESTRIIATLVFMASLIGLLLFLSIDDMTSSIILIFLLFIVTLLILGFSSSSSSKEKENLFDDFFKDLFKNLAGNKSKS